MEDAGGAPGESTGIAPPPQKCSSCGKTNPGCGYPVNGKTCVDCLDPDSVRNKRRQKAKEDRAAAKIDQRVDKKKCGSNSWCDKAGFDEGAKYCRVHQAQSRERHKRLKTQRTTVTLARQPDSQFNNATAVDGIFCGTTQQDEHMDNAPSAEEDAGVDKAAADDEVAAAIVSLGNSPQDTSFSEMSAGTIVEPFEASQHQAALEAAAEGVTGMVSVGIITDETTDKVITNEVPPQVDTSIQRLDASQELCAPVRLDASQELCAPVRCKTRSLTEIDAGNTGRAGTPKRFCRGQIKIPVGYFLNVISTRIADLGVGSRFRTPAQTDIAVWPVYVTSQEGQEQNDRMVCIYRMDGSVNTDLVGWVQETSADHVFEGLPCVAQMANEAGPGQSPNASLQFPHLIKEVQEGDVLYYRLVTERVIEAGEEILIEYGSTYGRSYPSNKYVGNPTTSIQKTEMFFQMYQVVQRRLEDLTGVVDQEPEVLVRKVTDIIYKLGLWQRQYFVGDRAHWATTKINVERFSLCPAAIQEQFPVIKYALLKVNVEQLTRDAEAAVVRLIDVSVADCFSVVANTITHYHRLMEHIDKARTCCALLELWARIRFRDKVSQCTDMLVELDTKLCISESCVSARDLSTGLPKLSSNSTQAERLEWMVNRMDVFVVNATQDSISVSYSKAIDQRKTRAVGLLVVRPDNTAHVSLYEYYDCSSNSLGFMCKLVKQIYGRAKIVTITGEKQQSNMEAILDGISVDGRSDEEMPLVVALAQEESFDSNMTYGNHEGYDSDEGADVVDNGHESHFSEKDDTARILLEMQVNPAVAKAKELDETVKANKVAARTEAVAVRTAASQVSRRGATAATVIKQQQHKQKDNVLDDTDDAPGDSPIDGADFRCSVTFEQTEAKMCLAAALLTNKHPDKVYSPKAIRQVKIAAGLRESDRDGQQKCVLGFSDGEIMQLLTELQIGCIMIQNSRVTGIAQTVAIEYTRFCTDPYAVIARKGYHLCQPVKLNGVVKLRNLEEAKRMLKEIGIHTRKLDKSQVFPNQQINTSAVYSPPANGGTHSRSIPPDQRPQVVANFGSVAVNCFEQGKVSNDELNGWDTIHGRSLYYDVRGPSDARTGIGFHKYGCQGSTILQALRWDGEGYDPGSTRVAGVNSTEGDNPREWGLRDREPSKAGDGWGSGPLVRTKRMCPIVVPRSPVTPESAVVSRPPVTSEAAVVSGSPVTPESAVVYRSPTASGRTAPPVVRRPLAVSYSPIRVETAAAEMVEGVTAGEETATRATTPDLSKLMDQAHTFSGLLPVVIRMYNDTHEYGLTPANIQEMYNSMSSFHGQSISQIYRTLANATTPPTESNEGSASVARVIEALRIGTTGRAKGINCHALVVSTVIIYVHSRAEDASRIVVLANCDHLQMMYEGQVILMPGERTGHFTTAGRYAITSRQLALSMIPAMSPAEISVQHRRVLEEHSEHLCPWVLLDLARCYHPNAQSVELYERAVRMIQNCASILGPELTWCLDAATINKPHMLFKPVQYLVQKIELLARSAWAKVRVDTHTANMIRDVRNLLRDSREDRRLEQLDSQLALICLPAYLSSQLSVLRPRHRAGNSTKTDRDGNLRAELPKSAAPADSSEATAPAESTPADSPGSATPAESTPAESPGSATPAESAPAESPGSAAPAESPDPASTMDIDAPGICNCRNGCLVETVGAEVSCPNCSTNSNRMDCCECKLEGCCVNGPTKRPISALHNAVSSEAIRHKPGKGQDTQGTGPGANSDSVVPNNTTEGSDMDLTTPLSMRLGSDMDLTKPLSMRFGSDMDLVDQEPSVDADSLSTVKDSISTVSVRRMILVLLSSNAPGITTASDLQQYVLDVLTTQLGKSAEPYRAVVANEVHNRVRDTQLAVEASAEWVEEIVDKGQHEGDRKQAEELHKEISEPHKPITRGTTLANSRVNQVPHVSQDNRRLCEQLEQARQETVRITETFSLKEAEAKTAPAAATEKRVKVTFNNSTFVPEVASDGIDSDFMASIPPNMREEAVAQFKQQQDVDQCKALEAQAIKDGTAKWVGSEVVHKLETKQGLKEFRCVVAGMLPASDGNPTWWRLVHIDGDEEQLDERQMITCRSRTKEYNKRRCTKNVSVRCNRVGCLNCAPYIPVTSGEDDTDEPSASSSDEIDESGSIDGLTALRSLLSPYKVQEANPCVSVLGTIKSLGVASQLLQDNRCEDVSGAPQAITSTYPDMPTLQSKIESMKMLNFLVTLVHGDGSAWKDKHNKEELAAHAVRVMNGQLDAYGPQLAAHSESLSEEAFEMNVAHEVENDRWTWVTGQIVLLIQESLAANVASDVASSDAMPAEMDPSCIAAIPLNLRQEILSEYRSQVDAASPSNHRLLADRCAMSALVDHHLSVLEHARVHDVAEWIKTAAKVQGVYMWYLPVPADGRCYAHLMFIALQAYNDNTCSDLYAAGACLGMMASMFNEWNCMAYAGVFDKINDACGSCLIYTVDLVAGLTEESVIQQMNDPGSKLNSCLFVVIQSPMCSQDLSLAGSTHFSVLTRNWTHSELYIREFRRRIGLCKISPAGFICRTRAVWLDNDVLKKVISGSLSELDDHVEEKVAVSWSSRFANSIRMLHSENAANSTFWTIQYVTWFIGIDIAVLMKTGPSGYLSDVLQVNHDSLAFIPQEPRQIGVPVPQLGRPLGSGSLETGNLWHTLLVVAEGHVVLVSPPDGSKPQSVQCDLPLLLNEMSVEPKLREVRYNGVLQSHSCDLYKKDTWRHYPMTHGSTRVDNEPIEDEVIMVAAPEQVMGRVDPSIGSNSRATWGSQFSSAAMITVEALTAGCRVYTAPYACFALLPCMYYMNENGDDFQIEGVEMTGNAKDGPVQVDISPEVAIKLHTSMTTKLQSTCLGLESSADSELLFLGLTGMFHVPSVEARIDEFQEAHFIERSFGDAFCNTKDWTGRPVERISQLTEIARSPCKTSEGELTMSTTALIHSTPRNVTVIQIRLNEDGEVTGHSVRPSFGRSCFTLLLVNINSAVGHAMVLKDNGITGITVLDGCDECMAASKFWQLQYGTAGDVIKEETRQYMLDTMGGEAKAYLDTESHDFCTDWATLHDAVTNSNDGTFDVQQLTLLNMLNSKRMLLFLKTAAKPCALLITNRPDSTELDATLNVQEHLWYKIRVSTGDDGCIKREGHGIKVKRSVEFCDRADALSDANMMTITPSCAALPTIVGRVQDLGADMVIGLRISELFAQVYAIPYGPWMKDIDIIYQGMNLIVHSFQFLAVRRAVKCYNNSVQHCDDEQEVWMTLIGSSETSGDEEHTKRVDALHQIHAEHTEVALSLCSSQDAVSPVAQSNNEQVSELVEQSDAAVVPSADGENSGDGITEHQMPQTPSQGQEDGQLTEQPIPMTPSQYDTANIMELKIETVEFMRAEIQGVMLVMGEAEASYLTENERLNTVCEMLSVEVAEFKEQLDIKDDRHAQLQAEIDQLKANGYAQEVSHSALQANNVALESDASSLIAERDAVLERNAQLLQDIEREILLQQQAASLILAHEAEVNKLTVAHGQLELQLTAALENGSQAYMAPAAESSVGESESAPGLECQLQHFKRLYESQVKSNDEYIKMFTAQISKSADNLAAAQDSLTHQTEQSRLSQAENGQLREAQRTASQGATADQNSATLIAEEAILKLQRQMVTLNKQLNVFAQLPPVYMPKDAGVDDICQVVQQMCTQITHSKPRKNKKTVEFVQHTESEARTDVYSELNEHQANALRDVQTFMFNHGEVGMDEVMHVEFMGSALQPISFVELLEVALGAPANCRIGELVRRIQNSEVSETDKQMVIAFMSESGVDNGRGQSNSDMATGLGRMVECVHELDAIMLTTEDTRAQRSTQLGKILKEIADAQVRVHNESSLNDRTSVAVRILVIALLQAARGNKPGEFRRYNEKKQTDNEAVMANNRVQIKKLNKTNAGLQHRKEAGFKAKDAVIQDLTQREQEAMSAQVTMEKEHKNLCVQKDGEIMMLKQQLEAIQTSTDEILVSPSLLPVLRADTPFAANELNASASAAAHYEQTTQLREEMHAERLRCTTAELLLKVRDKDLVSMTEELSRSQSAFDEAANAERQAKLECANVQSMLDKSRTEMHSSRMENSLKAQHTKFENAESEQEGKFQLQTVKQQLLRAEALVAEHSERIQTLSSEIAVNRAAYNKAEIECATLRHELNRVTSECREYQSNDNAQVHRLTQARQENVELQQEQDETKHAQELTAQQVRVLEQNLSAANKERVDSAREREVLVKNLAESDRQQVLSIQVIRDLKKDIVDTSRTQLNARVMAAEVSARYAHGVAAKVKGFGGRSPSGRSPSTGASHHSPSSRNNSSTPARQSRSPWQSASPGSGLHSSRRARSPSVSSTVYAAKERNEPHPPWLVVNNGDVQMIYGFVLGEVGDNTQILELPSDTNSNLHAYTLRLTSEFEDEINAGTIIVCSEAMLILELQIATLEDMDAIKAECRQHVQHREYRELRVFQEVESSLHNLMNGDTVYIKRNHRRIPGWLTLAADGLDADITLPDGQTMKCTYDVKMVYHIAGSCSDDECDQLYEQSSMMSQHSDSMSVESYGSHQPEVFSGSELGKTWATLTHGAPHITSWTRKEMLEQNNGKHFGMMRSLYNTLIVYKDSPEYVLFMLQKMTGNLLIMDHALSYFKIHSNGQVVGPKDEHTMVEALSLLFQGITGSDMASFGLTACAKPWDLLYDSDAWLVGDAERTLKRELALIEKNMPAGTIQQYADGSMYIDPIIVRSGLPIGFFDVTKAKWQQGFRQINDKDRFLARVEKDLIELMEGSTNSLFVQWTAFLKRVSSGYLGDSSDMLWINAGALKKDSKEARAAISEYTSGKQQDSTAMVPARQPVSGRTRGGRNTARAANITDDSVMEDSGVVYLEEHNEYPAFDSGLMMVLTNNRMPSRALLDEARNAAEPKSIADTHAKEPCKYHADLIMASKSFLASGRSEQEVLDSLHTTEECLAYQQKYIQCTVHTGGAEAIYKIYEAKDDIEGKRRWTAAADNIKQQVSQRITCVMMDQYKGGFNMHVLGRIHHIHCAVTLPLIEKQYV